MKFSRLTTKRVHSGRRAAGDRRAALLTGAKQIPDGSYRLRVRRWNFLVDYHFVRVISHLGISTCFSVAIEPDLPSAERVASALLLLKGNPKLFKKWRKQPGYMFKANGKMFPAAD